jgi:hypothetical protein
MARASVGAITISDIKDGINPIAMVLSNQHHSFATGSDGIIMAEERNAFSCEVFIFLGENRIEYDSNPVPAN